MDDLSKELRRIRNTLIVMAIILVFFVGNREVIVENNDDHNSPSYFHTMVPLQDGYFGVLSNDATWGDNGEFHIYHFDPETKEITSQKQVSFDELLDEE